MKTAVKTLITLAVIFGFCWPVSGCSLALHQWKLVFYLKIPVASPIFPLAELSAAIGKLPENATRQIKWVVEPGIFSQIAPVFLPLFLDWPAKIPWELISPDQSIMSMAKKAAENSDVPLVIGSDKCSLKIALFSDANSHFNCHQLVIMQNNRIRAVFPDKKAPWAQEINGQSWLSLIFFQLPVPGRILSFSVFPLASMRKSIFEDHGYVEKLLAEKKLFRRPDLVIDPFTFDFPELPE